MEGPAARCLADAAAHGRPRADGRPVYSLADYLWMMADAARVSAYANALRAQIHAGDRVLEIGAGFGVFSVIAARAGARVDAVDTNPIVHVGPRIAAANGCADRITFHHTDVSLLTIDAPADILLADLRGPTPFGARALETLIDARQRLLRPGGTIIARRDTIFVAPARAPKGVREEIHAARGQEGVALGPIEEIINDTPMRFSILPADLLEDGQPWLDLDYATLADTAFSGEVRWRFQRAARVEGLALWFEADLGAGYSFSTSPDSQVVAYRQMYIPLRTAVDVATGDALRLRLDVHQVRDNYLWEWRAWLTPRATTLEREVCHQNSLAEMVIDPRAFVVTSSDARPVLGPRGRALRELLGWMDGRETVDSLAKRLYRTAPELFSGAERAADFVAEWCQRAHLIERNAEQTDGLT